jgi:outer membrane protein assembly factor BamB
VGRLGAYDLGKKEEIWGVNLPERFGAKVPTYGYAESVLIDGDRIICEPGGPGAVVAALNKNTGETIWTTKGDKAKEGAGYSSAIVFEYEGLRQISIMSSLSLLGVAEDDGRLLWRYDRPSAEQNCSTPVFFDGYVFAATGYGTGGGLVKLKVSDGQVEAEQVWETKEMKAHHGGYVLVDGYIYGNNDNEGWTCIELATGKVTYKAKGVGKGSIAHADGMLYILSENGKMGLVEANPLEHKIVGEFMIPNAGGETRAHPVIADGKLLLRRHEKVFIYDIKDRTKEVQ